MSDKVPPSIPAAPQPPFPPGHAEDEPDKIISELAMGDPDDHAFNPAVVGLLPGFPAELDEADWIETACDKANSYGLRNFLRRMLRELRTAIAINYPVAPEQILDRLAGHVLGKQVSFWEPLQPPAARQGVLIFNDGHGVPIEAVDDPDVPHPARLKSLVGKYLVALHSRKDSQGRLYLVLFFHARPDAQMENGPQLSWDEVQGRGFSHVATAWTSAMQVRLPEAEANGGQKIPVAEAVVAINQHLRRQRVADKLLLPGSPPALIFDNHLVFPLVPVPGDLPLAVEALEEVVGLFLVLATPEDGGSNHVQLWFHSDINRAEPMLTNTLQSQAGAVIEAFVADPEMRALSVAPESAWRVYTSAPLD